MIDVGKKWKIYKEQMRKINMEKTTRVGGKELVQVHLHSKVSFPINQEFYGNGFVAAHTSIASRSRRNYILTRCKDNPLAEGRMGEAMAKLSREKYNLELGNFSRDEYVRKTVEITKRAIERGEYPTINLHFAINTQEIEILLEIREALGGENRGQYAIFAYLHCLPSASKANMLGETMEQIRKNTDGLIAVSEAVRADFERELGITSHTIINGIDPFLYSERSAEEKEHYRREMGISPRVKKLVTYVGRIDGMKGSNYLLETLLRFEKSRTKTDEEVGFAIGTGHLLTMKQAPRLLRRMFELERLIGEDRLKFVVDISKFTRSDPRFRGLIGETARELALENGLEETPNTLPGRAFGGFANVPVQSIGDIYLHPATNEALGLAIVEGMFTGNFVITTNVGGIPEIITPEIVKSGQGVLLDLPKDQKGTAKFVDEIVELIRNRGAQKSERAGDYNQYTIDGMFERYVQVVERTMDR